MGNKKCSICKEVKSLDLFYKSTSRSDGHSNNCVECQRKYSKAYYAQPATKERFGAKARVRTTHLRKLYYALKDNKPCMDCKVVHRHFALDYDHRDPSTKLKEVSQLVTYSEEVFRAEIAKCDLVCANCHRYRTHKNNDTMAE